MAILDAPPAAINPSALTEFRGSRAATIFLFEILADSQKSSLWQNCIAAIGYIGFSDAWVLVTLTQFLQHGGGCLISNKNPGPDSAQGIMSCSDLSPLPEALWRPKTGIPRVLGLIIHERAANPPVGELGRAPETTKFIGKGLHPDNWNEALRWKTSKSGDMANRNILLTYSSIYGLSEACTDIVRRDYVALTSTRFEHSALREAVSSAQTLCFSSTGSQRLPVRNRGNTATLNRQVVRASLR